MTGRYKFMKMKINQYLTLPDQGRVDSASDLVIVLPEARAKAPWPALPYADVLAERWQQRKAGNGKRLHGELPNRRGTRFSLLRLAPDTDTFELLTQARRLVNRHLDHDADTLTLVVADWHEEQAGRITEALLAAVLAGNHTLPHFKSKGDKSRGLKALDCFGLPCQYDFSRTEIEAEANNLVRDLTTLPPNHLSPASYRARIEKLATKHGWEATFYDQRELKRRKAGAFLAVAQGSDDKEAGIMQLRYNPGRKRKHPPAPKLALVGKGICFDTGGNNLKPARGMLGMHEDMAGSAVALGTLLALTRLHVDYPVEAWLALAQNHIGPRAYKPNDVVTAANGTTIEVVHTDAEGRMVLADTLALATAAHPRLLIDYATLTGACVSALGTAYSGAFSNRRALHAPVIQAGADSGERVWPFPTDNDYDKALDSHVADIRQCTLGGRADHILAARFLNRFIAEGVNWLHIDLSAVNHKGGLGHVPTEVTGFGVRFTLNLLLDQAVLETV